MGISTNRSNANLEGDYLIKGKLLVRGQVFWQRTHGGLRFGSPAPAELVFPGEVTPDLLNQHDRLARRHGANGTWPRARNRYRNVELGYETKRSQIG